MGYRIEYHLSPNQQWIYLTANDCEEWECTLSDFKALKQDTNERRTARPSEQRRFAAPARRLSWKEEILERTWPSDLQRKITVRAGWNKSLRNSEKKAIPVN